MERVCPKCGTLVTNDGLFCPECGTKLEGAVDLNKPLSEPVQPTSVPMQNTVPPMQNSVPMQNQIPPMGYSNPQYQQSFNNAPVAEPTEKMSVGSWVGTIILTTWFSLISFIITAVWAFGGSTPQPKKNYCKAVFIFDMIGIAVGVIGLVIIFCVIGFNFDVIMRWLTDFGDQMEIAFR